MLSHKKNRIILLMCSFFITSVLSADQRPWYKNGWKVDAAGYGAWALGCYSLGVYSYLQYKQLSKDKADSPRWFFFKLKDKEELKISCIATPCYLISGTFFALASDFYSIAGALIKSKPAYL